jgi:hypothetical protein
MKRGIRRLPRRPGGAGAAVRGLELLRAALDCFVDAGSCYTAARVRSAIASARGAVRAAESQAWRVPR